jgi:hypothetical protein
MQREIWAVFDKNQGETIAEIVNNLDGVRCEVRTPFVTVFYENDEALAHAHRAIASDPRLLPN